MMLMVSMQKVATDTVDRLIAFFGRELPQRA